MHVCLNPWAGMRKDLIVSGMQPGSGGPGARPGGLGFGSKCEDTPSFLLPWWDGVGWGEGCVWERLDVGEPERQGGQLEGITCVIEHCQVTGGVFRQKARDAFHQSWEGHICAVDAHFSAAFCYTKFPLLHQKTKHTLLSGGHFIPVSDWSQANCLYLMLLLQFCTWMGNCERGSNCHPISFLLFPFNNRPCVPCSSALWGILEGTAGVSPWLPSR